MVEFAALLTKLQYLFINKMRTRPIINQNVLEIKLIE